MKNITKNKEHKKLKEQITKPQLQNQMNYPKIDFGFNNKEYKTKYSLNKDEIPSKSNNYGYLSIPVLNDNDRKIWFEQYNKLKSQYNNNDNFLSKKIKSQRNKRTTKKRKITINNAIINPLKKTLKKKIGGKSLDIVSKESMENNNYIEYLNLLDMYETNFRTNYKCLIIITPDYLNNNIKPLIDVYLFDRTQNNVSNTFKKVTLNSTGEYYSTRETKNNEHLFNYTSPVAVNFNNEVYTTPASRVNNPDPNSTDDIFFYNQFIHDISVGIVIEKNTHVINKNIIDINDTDRDKFYCITYKWDRVLNPYLYNGPYPHPGPFPLSIVTHVPTALDYKLECRTTHGDIDTNVKLNQECANIINYYDNLYLYKAHTSNRYGIWFNDFTNTFNRQFVYRGMTKPYTDQTGQIINVGQIGIVQSYLHTSIDIDYSKTFMKINPYDPLPPNPTLYIFNVLPDIPYVSYDERKEFVSHFDTVESEIIFIRECQFFVRYIDNTQTHFNIPYTTIYADLAFITPTNILRTVRQPIMSSTNKIVQLYNPERTQTRNIVIGLL
jgi:hypothetical protein